MRKGRHRKHVKREPNGRAQRQRVTATQEQIAKKAVLVGPGKSLSMAESPVSVLLAREIINVSQEQILADFQRLYRFRNGDPFPQGALAEKTNGREPEEEGPRKRCMKTERYNEAVGILSRSEWNAIADVSIFRIMPRWFSTRRSGRQSIIESLTNHQRARLAKAKYPGDVRRFAIEGGNGLFSGLDKLDRYWGRTKRAA